MPRPGNLKKREQFTPSKPERLMLGKMARMDARQAFKDALDDKGITGLKLALRLNQALNAKIIKVFYDRKLNKIVESRGYVDHSTRLKAIEMIVSYFDMEPAKEIDLGGNLSLRNMSDDEIQSKIDEYAKQLGIAITAPGAGSKKKTT